MIGSTGPIQGQQQPERRAEHDSDVRVAEHLSPAAHLAAEDAQPVAYRPADDDSESHLHCVTPM